MRVDFINVIGIYNRPSFIINAHLVFASLLGQRTLLIRWSVLRRVLTTVSNIVAIPFKRYL